MSGTGREMGERWVEHTVTEAEAGRTLQEVLTGVLGVSRRRIQKLTRSRGIRLNRRAGFLGKKLRAGDVVAVREAADEEVGLEPVPMSLVIVHEDEELLVVDKPPSVLVHPTAAWHRATLAHGIAHHYLSEGLRAKVRLVHRLDRDTSGLVLVAKTAAAHQRLDRQLRDRELRREYLAFVGGVVSDAEGTIDAPIGRDPRNPNLRKVRERGGEAARTRFRARTRFAGATLLEVELETGRTHQVRVHLAHLGHPVLGDAVYGGASVGGLERPALHAHRLSFHHPASGEAVVYEAPLPADLRQLAAALREMSGD